MNLKEKIINKLVDGTSYELKKTARTYKMEKMLKDDIYSFHYALMSNDTGLLSSSAQGIDSNMYLAKGDTFKHRIKHSSIQKSIADYNIAQIFGDGVNIADDKLNNFYNLNKDNFYDVENTLTCLGSAFLWFHIKNEEFYFKVYKPHEITIVNEHCVKIMYDKYNEIHTFSEKGTDVTFQDQRTGRKLEESELNMLGISEYSTSFKTILYVKNNKKNHLRQPIGDLFNLEQSIDDIYNVLGKDARSTELNQDLYIFNDLLFEKDSLGNMTINRNNDVFMQGAMNDDKYVEQIVFESKTAEYQAKHNEAITRVYSQAGYNPISFGITDTSGANESGEALKVREARSIATINGKKEHWLKIFNEIFSNVNVVYNASDLTVTYSAEIEDKQSYVDLYINLYDRAIIGPEQLSQALSSIGIPIVFDEPVVEEVENIVQ